MGVPGFFLPPAFDFLAFFQRIKKKQGGFLIRHIKHINKKLFRSPDKKYQSMRKRLLMRIDKTNIYKY